MKKILFVLAVSLFMANGALAKHNCAHVGLSDCKVERKLKNKQLQKGGFVEAAVTPISVQRALIVPDGTKVMLIGHITNRLGKEEYNFTDGTDNIVAEIGKGDWNGQIISPKDKVVLKGKIEKDEDGVILNVKSVKAVN